MSVQQYPRPPQNSNLNPCRESVMSQLNRQEEQPLPPSQEAWNVYPPLHTGADDEYTREYSDNTAESIYRFQTMPAYDTSSAETRHDPTPSSSYIQPSHVPPMSSLQLPSSHTPQQHTAVSHIPLASVAFIQQPSLQAPLITQMPLDYFPQDTSHSHGPGDMMYAFASAPVQMGERDRGEVFQGCVFQGVSRSQSDVIDRHRSRRPAGQMPPTPEFSTTDQPDVAIAARAPISNQHCRSI